MASPARPPPPPRSSSPSQSPPQKSLRRKPLPLRDASNVAPDDQWPPPGTVLDHNGNPVPVDGPAHMRAAQAAPVRVVNVGVMPRQWPQPSNADIENSPPPDCPLDSKPLPLTPPAGPQPAVLPLRRKPLGPRQGSPHGSAHDSALDFGFTPQLVEPEPAAAAPDPSPSPGRDRPGLPSHQSSVATSASSLSGPGDPGDPGDPALESSAESSLLEYEAPQAEPVPQLQYHHQPPPAHVLAPRASSINIDGPNPRAASNPDLLDHAAGINRHLTPTSHLGGPRRTSIVRPASAYSTMSSDRGRSPYGGSAGNRAPSAHSRKSPETRPSSYADMLNVPYPQPAPAPIALDNSRLRNNVGNNASLLSTQQTLDMYRQNVKKTNDLSIQYSFAVFLIATAQEQGPSLDEPAPASARKASSRPGTDSPASSGSAAPGSSPQELVREAKSILQKLSNAGYPFAQYYLADGFASGLFSKGKEDYNQAFPLFVIAAKHGHAESAYRAGLCYEFGWGCRKDPAKAVQFLRTAAAKRHPGAMTRLGKACLSGDLGEKRYREGVKWLKLAAEAADTVYNAAPYQLACLYETGYGDDVFRDENYAAELFTQAAELGHPEASFRMGDAYEHGKLNCPRDPALSVHFYTGAAERGHAGAMMGLCAWYMVGAEPILDKDEEEAYEWARRSADLGLVKAQYAVGYFTEMGIGCRRDILEANVWYVKAADAGDDRAKQRLAAIRAAAGGGSPMAAAPPRNAAAGKARKGNAAAADDGQCVVM